MFFIQIRVLNSYWIWVRELEMSKTILHQPNLANSKNVPKDRKAIGGHSLNEIRRVKNFSRMWPRQIIK